MMKRFTAILAAGAVGALALTGCGADEAADDAPAAALEAAPEAQNLAGACPAKVVVQLQWQPQSDMGAMFGLLGPDAKVDANAKSISGSLVAQGKDTGVDLELRAGGPAIGFQSVPSQMYVDQDITLGLVHGDQLVAASGEQRVIGVSPLLSHSPAILLWDPATFPDWKTIGDIGKSDAAVVVSKGQYYPAWLVAQGLLKKSQIDESYDGSPARFASRPDIALQGYANSEPYTFEKQTPAWNKPVAYQLLKDAGYDTYAANVSVRADKLDALSPCLEKLVPIIQQSGVDYITSPDAVNKVITDMVADVVSFSPYSEGEAAYSAKLLKDEGLLANEADGSLGTYDAERVNAQVEMLTPVLKGAGVKVPGDLKPEDFFTDRFTDHKIGVK
ncbi:nitrate ABC transporter substrate-binding protein [Actinocorallia sp. A-T 12471]|uniref:nitrate ABC transporter substrate-binding protein n=1 Tax=Actinocorallia sp. A-T 12471 TaxID=3089813 RepID=UPI0029D18240|nr:nitrate ABC transporter substrate-binding protein [Actinocorallia sp. A-T 12471]MDX6740126.1 nitrate ABC transporter substrate-binding protein [Actinocorallia sp. A-T 12471]